MKKRTLALVLTLAMTLSLAACGSSGGDTAADTAADTAEDTAEDAAAEDTAPAEEAQTADGDAPYIIMVNALNGHPVYEQQAEAARKAAEDYGVNLEIIGPSMGSSTLMTDTVSAIENAITMAPDAIILEPVDSSLFSLVAQATASGIPVFCTSNGTDNPDDYVSCIGTDNTQYGITAVDMIAEATGGEAHILVVMGALTTVNQVEQLEGMRARIDEMYPNMEIVNVAEDGNDLSKAVTLFQDNFNTYPEIDTVVMLESTGGPGAAQVAQEMNKEVRILDIDAVEETIDNILSGDEWATLAQNFYKRGYESVRMAYEYITQNGEVEYDSFIDSGTVLITQDNASTYEEDLWAAVKVKGTEW